MAQKGSHFPMLVTYVESKCRGPRCEIWAQRELSECYKLESLLAGLESAQGKTSVTVQPNPGDIILARYRKSGQWCRAQVLPSEDEAKVNYRVHLIDIGNVEIVQMSDMLQPSFEFCTIPPLGEKFLVDGICPRNGRNWTESEMEHLNQNFRNRKFVVEIVNEGTTGFPATVRLTTGLGSAIQPSPFQPPPYNLVVKPGKLQVDKNYEVEVTHVLSKMNFWVQLVVMKHVVEKMNIEICSDIQAGYLSRVASEEIYPGFICTALNRMKNCYARAVICEVNFVSQTCIVTFIDYGTTEIVAFANLFLVPVRHLELPTQALKCCLVGRWAAVDLKTFLHLTDGGRLYIRVTSMTQSGQCLVEFVQETLLSLPISVPSQPLQAAASWETMISSTGHMSTGRPMQNYPLVPTMTSAVPKLNYLPLQFDISKPQNVCISNVDDNGAFYCQLLCFADQLNSLMMMLNHTPTVPLKSGIMEGMPCVVRNPLDRIAYRAKIIKQSDKDRVFVEMVDFGTRQETTIYDVLGTTEAAMMVPVQAIACRLFGADEIPAAVLGAVLRRYESRIILIARIVSKVTDFHVVELYDTSTSQDINLLDMAKDMADPLRNVPHKVTTCISQQSCVPAPAKLPLKMAKQLVVTSVIDACCFIGKLYPTDKLNALEEEMHKYYTQNNVPCLPAIVPDMYCCCQYLGNQHYYRAKVLSSSQTQWVVEFVDHGIQEVKDRSQLKVLLPQFGNLPCQGVCCFLSSEYGPLTRDLLADWVLNCVVTIYVTGQVDHGFIVRLVDCDANRQIFAKMNRSFVKNAVDDVANQELLEKLHSLDNPTRDEAIGFKELEIATSTWLDCCISFVESPSDFFCQLSSKNESMDALRNDIEQHVKLHPPGINSIHKAVLGLPVLAKYELDGQWYRGVITGVLKASNKMEVFFVDYGNRDIVSFSNIQTIPITLQSVPAMAFGCCLAGLKQPKNILWSENEVDQFAQIVDQKQLKLCYLGERNHDKRHIVHLLNDQENVNRSFLKSVDKMTQAYSSPVINQVCREPDRTDVNISLQKPTAYHQTSHSLVKSDNSTGDRWPAGENQVITCVNRKPKQEDRTRAITRGPLFQTAIKDVISNQVKEHLEHPQIEFPNRFNNRRAENSVDSQKSISKNYTYPTYHCDESFGCTISYVFHPGKFFCQRRNSPDLEKLTDNLNTVYGNLGDGDNSLHVLSLAKGQACCARYSGDDLWYRARVLTVDSSSAAKVQFVDYGNEETVSLTKIRHLHETFFDVPVQAVQCSLYGLEPISEAWPPDSVEKFDTLVGADDMIMKIVEFDSSCNGYKVYLTSEASGACIHSALITAGFARATGNLGQNANIRSERECVPHFQTLEVGSSAEVYISHVVSPGNFWCQLVKESSQLDDLMKRLGEDYDAMSINDLALLHPIVGQFCCARYSCDEQWYRARIVAVVSGQIKICYIDYGNEEMVPGSNLKKLKSEYTELSSQAFKCSLSGITETTNNWCDSAIAAFSELTVGITCNIIVRANISGQCEVELFAEQKEVSINKEFVLRGHANDTISRLSPPSEKRVSDVNREPLEKRPNVKEVKQHQSTTVEKFNSDIRPLKASVTKSGARYTQLLVEVGTQRKVITSWVISPAEFYCQLEENCGVIEEVQEKLHVSYQQMRQSELQVDNPCSEEPCVTLFEADRNWYRCKIMSVQGLLASVFYVDYGNTEKVPLAKLKRLMEQLLLVPVQAVRCCLVGADYGQNDAWDSSVIERLSKFLSKPVFFRFVDKVNEVYMVEVTTEEGHVINSDILGVKKSLERPASSSYKVGDQHWKPGDVLNIYVVSVEDNKFFFCQLVDKTDLLDALMTRLASYYEVAENAEEPMNLCVGDLCAAKYSGDGQWYRANVEFVGSDGQVRVRFVDYGNQEFCPKTDVKCLKPEFCDLPFQCYKCILAKQLSVDEMMIDVILDRQFKATVVRVLDKVLYVDLTGEDGESVGCAFETSCQPSEANDTLDSLYSSGQQHFVIPQAETDVCIVNAISPSEFFIQVIEHEEKLTEMGSRLHLEYSSLAPNERCLSKLEVGKLCCAKFSEDSSWYRAVIQKINGNMIDVLFVDYGNFDCVNSADVKELLDCYCLIPYFAAKCLLKDLICPVNGWAEHEIQQFITLTESGCKVFSCTFCSAEEPFSIILRDGGDEVCKLFLQPLLPEDDVSSAPSLPSNSDASSFAVYVSHVNSPSDFYIQFVNKQNDLDQLSANLEDYVSHASTLLEARVGSICTSIYSADGAWYRAVIERLHDDSSTATVLFIDYGNTDVVNLESLKQLSIALSDIDPFATHCTLLDLPAAPDFSSTSAGEVMTRLVSDKELEALIDSKDQPCVIQLKIGATSVLDLLCEEMKSLVPVMDLHDSVTEDEQLISETESKIAEDARGASIPRYAVPVIISGKFKVIVTSIDSFLNVYLQLAKDSAELEALLDLIDESYSYLKAGDLDLTQQVMVGQACCVRLSKVWYRATVEEVLSDNTLSVYLIDSGRVKVVAAAEVKQVIPKLLEIRPLIFKSSLVGYRMTEADPAMKDRFQQLVSDRVLTAQILANETSPIVMLYDKEVCINSALFDIPVESLILELEEAAQSSKIERSALSEDTPKDKANFNGSTIAEYLYSGVTKGRLLNVHVTYAANPHDFWVTSPLELSNTDLSLLMDRIKDIYSGDSVDQYLINDVNVGMICVAKYEDSVWYRARIIAVLENDFVQVLFIDYGNTFEVHISEIRELGLEYADLPPQAVRAFLSTIKPCNLDVGWDEASSNRFAELVMYESKEFDFEVKEAIHGENGQLLEIRGLLFDGSIDVAAELLHGGYAKCATWPDSDADNQGFGNLGHDDKYCSQTEGESAERGQVYVNELENQLNDEQSLNVCVGAEPSDTFISHSDQDIDIPAAFAEADKFDDEIIKCVDYSQVVQSADVEFSKHMDESASSTSISQNEYSSMQFELEDNNDQSANFAVESDVCACETDDYTNEPDYYCRAVDEPYHTNVYSDKNNESEFVTVDDTKELVNNMNGITCEPHICNGDEPEPYSTTSLLESDQLEDLESNQECFYDPFMEVSLRKRDSLGNLTGTADTVISDQLAFPSIKLVAGDILDVMLISFGGCDILVCQLVSCLQKLQTLMEKLQISCQCEESHLDYLKPNQPCAAYLLPDNYWCRAQVNRVLDEGNVEVYCVDVGMMRNLPMEYIRLLEQEFLGLPAQALHLSLTTEYVAEERSRILSLQPGTIMQATIIEANASNIQATATFSSRTLVSERSNEEVLAEDTEADLQPIRENGNLDFQEDKGCSPLENVSKEKIAEDGTYSDDQLIVKCSRSAEECLASVILLEHELVMTKEETVSVTSEEKSEVAGSNSSESSTEIPILEDSMVTLGRFGIQAQRKEFVKEGSVDASNQDIHESYRQPDTNAYGESQADSQHKVLSDLSSFKKASSVTDEKQFLEQRCLDLFPFQIPLQLYHEIFGPENEQSLDIRDASADSPVTASAEISDDGRVEEIDVDLVASNNSYQGPEIYVNDILAQNEQEEDGTPSLDIRDAAADSPITASAEISDTASAEISDDGRVEEIDVDLASNNSYQGPEIYVNDIPVHNEQEEDDTQSSDIRDAAESPVTASAEISDDGQVEEVYVDLESNNCYQGPENYVNDIPAQNEHEEDDASQLFEEFFPAEDDETSKGLATSALEKSLNSHKQLFLMKNNCPDDSTSLDEPNDITLEP